MTLLETLLAMSLLATISAIGAQAVRISWQSWAIQDQCADGGQHLTGVLSHITRQLRMAKDVVGVSAATDIAGHLTITQTDDRVVKWMRDSATDRVRFGADPPSDLLAAGITALTFECFQEDGVTPTIVAADIRAVRATASMTVPVQGTTQSLSTVVWIRKQQSDIAAIFRDFDAPRSSTPSGWLNHTNLRGSPDGVVSSGPEGSSVRAFGFDTSGLTGAVGTVLVGFYLNLDGPIGGDTFDVQLSGGSVGPRHSFGADEVSPFVGAAGWLWIDVTDDFASWSYGDVGDITVQIANTNSGVGGTTIRLDAVAIRVFDATPTTALFWMSSIGPGSGGQNEWTSQLSGLGVTDGALASSFFDPSSDRQSYAFMVPSDDPGTIVRVRLLVNGYVTAPTVDDTFTTYLHVTAAPWVEHRFAASTDLLNAHVGVANQGWFTFDYSNHEQWSWPSINAHYVGFAAERTGETDANLHIDGVALEVRYVPPQGPAVVLWEEL